MAVANETAATALPGRAFLRLGGPGAREFLQGLVSNDVRLLAPGRAVWTALLTPQGKYLYDFFLYDRGEAVLLEVEEALADELARRLVMYRLRAPVEIEADGSGLAVAALWPGGADAPAAAAADMPAAADDAVEIVADPRHPALGWRAVGPAAALEALPGRLRPAPFEDYDRHRIALGVPDGRRDLVPQKTILLEANFETLNGVAFDKGCFIGQELTARTKHRGLVKKRLVPVRLDGPAPPEGSRVTLAEDPEREAGELFSRAGDLALALLRLDSRGRPLRAGEALVTPLDIGAA